MKKKILLFFILALGVCCLFAITSFANEIPEWTDITVVEGMSDKVTFGADGTAGATSRVYMSDNTTYPAYYVCNDSETIGISLAELNEKAEKNYNASDIIRIEMPIGIKTVSTALRASNGFTGILTVVIPEGCTTINGSAFAIGSKIVSNIIRVELPSTIETVGASAFEQCEYLTDVYSKSPIIGQKMFYNCFAIKNIVLENTVEIRDHAFCSPNKQIPVESFVLPEGLELIGQYALPRAQITELVLPSTLVTVGTNAFAGCSKLEKVVVLGTTMGTNMFNGCGSLDYLVLTEKFVTGDGSALKDTAKSFTTFYTGEDFERIKTLLGSTSRINTAKGYTYAEYSSEGFKGSSCMIIYNSNLCTVGFDNIHTEPKDDSDCTTAVICSVCKEYTFKEALTHKISKKVTYTSFMQEGEYYVGCTNEGCNHGSSEALAPMFRCLGYSVCEYGSAGIALCFGANNVAISKYEELTNSEINYGLFVVLEEKLGDNYIFDQNGTASNGVINTDFTRLGVDLFEIKIGGFKEEYKDMKLIMGAYVGITNKDETSFTYLQAGIPCEGEKYHTITYSEICK